MLDQRGRLLVAALGFAGLPMLSYDRALWALRSWLDSWPGIGAIATGMARQGFDLQLTRYDEKGWRATFYATGMEHSITSATASAWNARRRMPSRVRREMRSAKDSERDAVLYELSTLAQTCAALAAFVGAVGIFRLQALRDGRVGEGPPPGSIRIET